MKRASAWFTAEEKARIAEAVQEAESKTAAEIVPAVATASGRYDRAEDIAGLWLGAILLVLAWLWMPWERTEHGSWDLSWAQFQLPVLLGALVLGFVAGAVLASRWGGLRMLFTSRQEMRDEVAARARQLFFDQRVHHTTGQTGILLFLSLYERSAAVIADAQTTEKLGQPVLDELCQDLTAAMRSGTPAAALVQVIRACGDRLATQLPHSEAQQNELSNALVLLD